MVIAGVILVTGAILVINNFNKINLVKVPLPFAPKSSSSWLYKVDLTKCQSIVDRARLNDELEVVIDPELTWQHRCHLNPKQSSIDAFSLKEVIIDALYDEQGVIDPVGNALKFKTKDPIVDFVADKYVGKNYQDIFQEPDAINDNFESYKWGLSQGYERMTQGTFATDEGEGAYFVIDDTRSDQSVQGYRSFAHAKNRSCNIIMATEVTYDDSKRKGLEEQLVGMMQKIDKAIKGECGNAQLSPVTQPFIWALIDKPAKESDFQKVAESDFKIVFPVTPESVKITSEKKLFLGVVGGGGEVLVELPNGDNVTVEEKQAIDIKFGDLWKEWRFSNRFPQNNWKGHVTVREVDCHILLAQEEQDRETLQRLGEIRRANRYDLGDTLRIESIGDCSYINEGGPVRVLAQRGKVSFKTLGKTKVSAEKADFGIGYDATSGMSIIEVYNGSVMVEDKASQTKKISAVYGSQINRIELDKDGAMVEKIAIPQSEWETFLANSQQTETGGKTSRKTLPIITVIVALSIGGTALFLHRKGKLIPQISSLFKKNNSNNSEREES
ncbi:MAG: hypothetical protein HY376_00620 [Candidatus Blackburnbacteria bacterium]|nr:hypothetical protein [Candidatus Blackburnbacteria bacterium]